MKKYLTVLSVMTLLFACESAPQKPPPKSPPKKAARSKPRRTPAPAATPQAEKIDDVFAIKSKQFDYTYNPIQKRDPFKPYEGEVTYFEEGERTPLERFALSQLQLTAVVWGIAEPLALVRAPDGQDYIVKREMKIGRNSGRVSRITKKELVVAEEYRDPLGKLIVKETPLLLRSKGELDKLMLELQ